MALRQMQGSGDDDLVNPKEFKSGTGPKLEITDFDGDTTVAVISEVERVKFNQDKQERVGLRVRFREFGDKAIFVVAQGDVQILTERLGDRFRAWIGEKCVLEKAIRSYDNKTYEKVVVAPADEWDRVIASRSRAKPKPKAKGRR